MTPERDRSNLSYEALQAHEDGRYLRFLVALWTVWGGLCALWIDRALILVCCAAMTLFLAARVIWDGASLIRSGYGVRGRASMRRIWWPFAGLAASVAILTAQARLGLWFDQIRLTPFLFVSDG